MRHAAKPMRICKALNEQTHTTMHAKGVLLQKPLQRPSQTQQYKMVKLMSSCWNENMLSCTFSTAATAGMVVIANNATICRHGMCSKYSVAALHAVCITLGTE
jgi:hypothetical protein